jgi:hypothetical protein
MQKRKSVLKNKKIVQFDAEIDVLYFSKLAMLLKPFRKTKAKKKLKG